MDAGVLTTLGGTVAMLLAMRAAGVYLRKGQKAMEGRLVAEIAKIRSDIRDQRQDVGCCKWRCADLRKDVMGLRAEMRDLKRDVVGLQVDMGIVKHHLGIAPDESTEISRV